MQIYGDALTWWDQAAGRYARGSRPKPGAVMAFRPSGNMVLGHVAAVSRVIDSRTVLLDHANWSPINGRRGQIERGVKAVDVSPANDWSQVRVWYAPLGDLGTTAWPVEGFIYADRANDTALGGARALASARLCAAWERLCSPPLGSRQSRPHRRSDSPMRLRGSPRRNRQRPLSPAVRSAQAARPVRLATAVIAPRPKAQRMDDPLAAALAKYDR